MMINNFLKYGVIIGFGMLISCGNKGVELAVIETELGRIIIQFYEDVAPKHVESFKILASEGYFDGSSFHRVIPGFVIQGGDPSSKDEDRMNDGQGGRAGKFYGIGEENNRETWRLPAEFNERRHVTGAVSMARSKDKNSAGSQFFICVDPILHLDGQYTVFGQVIEGIEVVDKIVNVDTPVKSNPIYGGVDKDNPLKPVQMKIYLSTDKELQIDMNRNS